MFQNLLKRLKSDSGDSLVSAVIVFPLVIMLIITGIDYSIFMSNRAQIQGSVRDAARTVAIMGGNGNQTKSTPIEYAYGTTRSQACAGIAAKDAITTIECSLFTTLKSQNGLVNVTFTDTKNNQPKSITCGGEVSTFVGQRVTCKVAWVYNGIPGSIISLMKSNNQNYAEGSAESEVKFSTSDLVTRR